MQVSSTEDCGNGVRASELNIGRNRLGSMGNLEYRILNILYLDGGAVYFVGERVSIKCVSVLIKSKQFITKSL
jgi:hypothetical protein